MCVMFYHISHLLVGFIGDPNLHWNSSENSFEFDSGPMTRNFGGECGSFSICRLVVSSVTAEHQTYGGVKRIKNFGSYVKRILAHKISSVLDYTQSSDSNIKLIVFSYLCKWNEE